MTARYIIGDTRDVVASMPDGSVDLVLTSPPFLALRSYLPADHPDKAREIGSEGTPGAFLDVLLDLAVGWRRVLAPHGSICIELGDTYAGSGGAGGDYVIGGLRDGQQAFDGSAKRRRKENGHAVRDDAPRPPRNGRLASPSDGRGNPSGMRDTTFSGSNTRPGIGDGWPLGKSLCGIPHLFHLSLAYGRNLLTGREIEPWRVRNVVAWCRPNPPVGALGDKFRPATSYMTIATVARDRYFDLDAVRTPPKNGLAPSQPMGNGLFRGHPDEDKSTARPNCVSNPAGAPPLDWWEISTQPYKGSHYATWPEALCDRPILSMVPPKVCTTCGEPSRRILGEPEYVRTDTDKVPPRLTMLDGERPAEGVNQHTREDGANTSVTRVAETVGWTDCGHDTWRRGVVLDPFGGSGTTGKVAVHHGRDAVLIDIDDRNADLARERVGMFLTVEHFTPQPSETATC